MKYLQKLIILFAVILGFSSCDTYGDYDVEYNVVYPLGGEYEVNLYNAANGESFDSGFVVITNTAAEDKDKIWFTCYGNDTDLDVKDKIGCNVKALTFEGQGDGYTVSEGKLELKGFTTSANTKIDKITFKIKLASPINGVTELRAEGNRYEYWE